MSRASVQLLVVRPLDPVGAGPVLEAAYSDEPSRRVTIWPGPPPTWALPPHPGLAPRVGRGRVGGRPVWLEERPPGVLLADVPVPLSGEVAAGILAALADSLAALHRADRAHGEVQIHRVALRADGTPILLGAGLAPGTASDDLIALRSLAAEICTDPLPLEAPRAEEIHEALLGWLRTHQGASVGLELAGLSPAPVPEDARRVELEPVFLDGVFDEASLELGPDEAHGGLFDRDARSDPGGEDTGELAGDVDRPLFALLAREAAEERGLSRLAHMEGVPSELVKALIADEPLDPLPVPNGIPLRSPGWTPGRDQDVTVVRTVSDPTGRFAEVTASMDPPTEITGSETTGFFRAPTLPRAVVVFTLGVLLTLGAVVLVAFFLGLGR